MQIKTRVRFSGTLAPSQFPSERGPSVMRRILFSTLGILEILVAAVLIFLVYLSTRTDVADAFTKAERVTRRASNQVRLVQVQVENLHGPEMRDLAQRLQEQTRLLTAALQTKDLDFDTLGTLSDAVGDMATGLEGLANSFQATQIDKLGSGLGEAANFLEKVIPTATKSADDLEKATTAMQADARRLQVLLKETPVDLKGARAVHDSLARFAEGLAKFKPALNLERLDTMREGFRGMQTSLATGAEQVERLGGFTYPVVAMNGLKPEVTQRPFWPEAGSVAAGLRKASDGILAGSKEVDRLAQELPKLRAALDESRQIVEKTRDSLGDTLRQEEKLEPLLKDMPAKAAFLAEQLPALGKDLAQLLRDTGKLKEVATALHQTQKVTDNLSESWPALRVAMLRSATLLKTTRGHLDGFLQNRRQLEEARRQAVDLGESFATMVPLFSDQIEGQLQEQDRGLTELRESIDEVGDLLPAFGTTMARLFQVGRLLAWLVAAIICLHGTYLLLSARIGRRYSM